MAQAWSERENDIIRENYPNFGTRVCCALLRQNGYERTEAAIKEHAKNMGVRRDMTKITRVVESAWTKQELDVLRQEFPNGGGARVAEVLGALGYERTVGAINTRAAMLGIRMKNTKRRMERGGDKMLVHICLDTQLDSRIIDKIKRERNRSAYIRRLIARDIDEQNC